MHIAYLFDVVANVEDIGRCIHNRVPLEIPQMPAERLCSRSWKTEG